MWELVGLASAVGIVGVVCVYSIVDIVREHLLHGLVVIIPSSISHCVVREHLREHLV